MSPVNHHHHHQRPPAQHQGYIVTLKPDDVILGRGAGPNEHSGNIAFREIVLDLKPSYNATVNRKMKSHIASKVIKAIRARGGRFLKRAPGREDEVFVLADEDVIVEKAKQALRHGRCTVKPRKGRVCSTSSLSTTSSTAASHSGSATSPVVQSVRNATMVFGNPPPLSSTSTVATTATNNNNILAMILLAQQQQQQQQQCNAIIPSLIREPVTVTKDTPSLLSSSLPTSSNLTPTLQDSSTYQSTLQLLMVLAESKRRESSTAECLELVELAEMLIASRRANETAVKTIPEVPPEASLLPCNLIAQLLLSQQQQEQQQNSLLSPQSSLLIPSSYGAACFLDTKSNSNINGINARLLSELPSLSL